MNVPWTLRIEEPLYARLVAHLFPGDGDEHGAVIAAGLVLTERGTRLLARDLFLAQDGIDFVASSRGYRMLTPEFVRDRIFYCRDQRLAYLAVHNHGGRDSVGFSEPDNRSHERGYPALLDISGQPVGALVIAESAIAGDIWTPDRRRRPITETIIIGRNLARQFPAPPPRPPKADATYDRQVRWFGDRGQELLGRAKVAVVGAGGVGQPLITMLARLGIGTLVVIDPDRVDPTNLPRMPEARRTDAMTALRRVPGTARLASRLSTRKVSLARRSVRRASRATRFIGVYGNVIERVAVRELVDCDYIFLAADSHLARMVVNAVGHQYLVPAVQLGTRIEVDKATGDVGDIRTNVRLIVPGTGCLRCNRLISGARVQEESLGAVERERNRYLDEVPAPSVITFNTWAAAQTASDFILMLGGLISPDAPMDYVRCRPRGRVSEPVRPLANRTTCPDCGTAELSRRARGDSAELPLPQRS